MGAAVPFVVAGIIGTAASAIAGAIMQRLAEDPEMERTQGLQANTRDPSTRIPIVYGSLRVGGNDVFIETTGPDNKHIWIIQTLSEGECDSVSSLKLGDRGEGTLGSNSDYWFYTGTSSQSVDSHIHAEIPKFTDPMRFTCYLVWKLTYDVDKFQSLPQRTALLRGRKLFDFRDDTTAYSTNPVLALYDFMTNTRYGHGFSSARFDFSSWSAAANYCDAKEWTINMRIDKTRSSQDVLDSICNLFRGQLVWYEGRFYLRYSDLNYESSSMTLTDKHILQNQNGVAEISIHEPGSFDVPDGLRVTFINANKDHVEDHVIIGNEAGVVEEISLDGCTHRQQASDLGVYILERLQLDRTIGGTFRDEAVKLEAHDIVTLTSSTFAITDQAMRVQSAVVRPDGLIDLVLKYETVELYDDDYDTEIEEGVYECDLPDPFDEPPSVSGVIVTEEAYNYRLISYIRLKIAFDEPVGYPWFDRVEVWVSHDDISYEHQFNATDDFAIEPVADGEAYYILLKVVSIHGVRQTDEHAYKIYHVVNGVTGDIPPSVDGLYIIVNGTGIELYSNRLTDPDIEHYEFRLGASWNGSIFLAAMKAPNLSLIGVKPGTHTFWINTYSTGGMYGANPRSASATLIDPPDNWALQDSETCDYQESDDDHHNTEHILYSGDDYLIGSHGSAGLVGTYTSPIYDLGASGRYLCYILADIIMIGTGTTWDDVIPDNSVVATTWDDIDISTRTWTEIFELTAAAQVKMKILSGDTSPPTNEVSYMEILSAILTGRYFQVEIEITDPSAAVNALVENFILKFCQ